MIMNAKALGQNIGIAKACASLNVSRMTEYRTRQAQKEASPRMSHPRALSAAEREKVVAVLSSDVYVDSAPASAYAALLDDGVYLCSVSTMYRLLRAHKAVLDRRNQRRLPKYNAPQLVAKRPNEVWSWDISVPQRHREVTES